MRLIKLSDAATIHGVSERTVRRWIADGELKCRKVGRTVWVHPQAVSRVADSKTRRARPKKWTLD